MTREEAILYMVLYRAKLLDSVSDLDKDIEAYDKAISALTAQKEGHWYYDEEREATGIYAICSNCDEKIYQTGDFKFCPNCGAKMEGAGE